MTDGAAVSSPTTATPAIDAGSRRARLASAAASPASNGAATSQSTGKSLRQGIESLMVH
jgi:hypothetical protein